MVLKGENIRKIHKKIYENTINMPKMFLFMSKVAKKASKVIDKKKNKSENAEILLILFKNSDYNGKIKSIINKKVTDEAENKKIDVIKHSIKEYRSEGKYIYLASSHNDCAEDHKAYQGKLYYDDKAPNDIIEWCKNRGMHSIQWVMGKPVWFITRPNCRHWFKPLLWDVVKKYNKRELQRRYKTHRLEGDRSLSTPAKIAVEEYEDRLKMLQMMYNEHPTEHLRRDIQKTKLLLKKWKNVL